MKKRSRKKNRGSQKQKKRVALRSTAFSLLGGAFFGCAFVIPALWPLVFLGSIPFYLSITDRLVSLRHTFFNGLLGGCIIYGCAIYGVSWHTLPLTWLGIDEPGYQFTFMVICWSVTSAAMAVSVGLFAAAVKWLYRDDWSDIFLFPSAWVLAEVLGAFIFSVINYGPGVFLNIDLTLGFIGSQLAEDIVLLQAAWLGGVFALSALASGLGIAAYRAYVTHSSRERLFLYGFFALMLCAYLIGHGYFRFQFDSNSQKTPSASFAVLATDLRGPYDPAVNIKKQERLLDEVTDADIVVLPEVAELFLKLQLFDKEMPEKGRFYVDSLDIYEEDGKLRSRVDAYDPQTNKTTHSYKQSLLPLGEYIPYLYLHAGYFFGVSDTQTYQEVVGYRQHVAGKDIPLITTSEGVRLGVLFCNESLSTHLYQSLTKEGANVLVNIASQLWFNESRTVFLQLQHAAQIRAVENGRWLVQSNNVAPAFVLDNRGRVVSQTAWGTQDVIRMDVPLLEHKTPYSIVGPWLLILPFIILLTLLAVRQREISR